MSEWVLSEYVDVRQFALKQITRNYRKNKELLEGLYDLMLDEDISLRTQSLEVIWLSGMEDRYEIFESSLMDDEKAVRELAARLLLNSDSAKSKQVIEAYKNELKSLPSDDPKKHNSVVAFYEVYGDKSGNFLFEMKIALYSGDKELQKAVVDVILKHQGDKQAVGIFNRYLSETTDQELNEYFFQRLSEENVK